MKGIPQTTFIKGMNGVVAKYTILELDGVRLM